MASILAVANQKGGVGKTTTAINLSASLALGGYRTLLVDLDPQGNASTGLGVSKRHTVGILSVLRDVDAAIEDGIHHLSGPNLSIIPSESGLGETHASPHLANLKALAEAVGGLYDFILVDCPPSSGAIPRAALAVCSAVIIPVQCEFYAMEGLAQVLSTIDQVRRRTNAALTVKGILLTMFDEGLKVTWEIEHEVRRHFGSQLLRTLIPRDVELVEAPSHGQPIIEYSPASRGALAYVALGREFLDHV